MPPSPSKTTTLMAISGVVKPRSGSIRFAGKDLVGVPAHTIVGLGIAQSPEGRKIFPRLTVLENLEMGAFGRTDREAIKKDIEHVYELFPILSEAVPTPAGIRAGHRVARPGPRHRCRQHERRCRARPRREC